MSRKLATTRIAVVEDHTLFAEALDVALTFEGHDVHRVAPGADGRTSPASVLGAVLGVRARIVLLDLGLGPCGSGLPLIAPITRSGAQVVVVTASTDRVVWGECLCHGASAVLSKSEPLNAVLAAVRLLGEGRAVMPLAERELLMSVARNDRSEVHDARRRLALLTPRERQILGHLMHGRSVITIARSSIVSEATVRTQVKAILYKLEVSSQLAAVSLAHRASSSADPVDVVA